MLTSLTYVSRSRLPEDDSGDLVARIIEQSISWNGAHGITGGLLYTGHHFAQTLEGEEFEVLSLVEMIRRDPRHDGLQILFRQPVKERDFSSWWMAYRGRTSFVDRKVEAARPDSSSIHPVSPQELRELIKLFALQRALSGQENVRAEPAYGRT